MNNEEKMFELMTKMYSEMQKGFKDVNEKIGCVEVRLDKVETRLKNIEGTVLRIENDNGQKLNALFDGYKQNSDKLDRIETEVAKHEEVILRRIR